MFNKFKNLGSKIKNRIKKFINSIVIKVEFWKLFKFSKRFKNKKLNFKEREIDKKMELDNSEYIEAYCLACKDKKKMKKEYFGGEKLNLRESFLCENCNLNNRLRASYALMEKLVPDFRGKNIYITEQLTPLFDLLSRQVKNLNGSEFFSDSSEREVFFPKANKNINNENLTRLSFEDSVFDLVLSFEVLEHVPDYKKALQEIYRVLDNGGHFIFTIPFVSNSEKTLIRAKISNGEVENVLPPEYHGDPVDEAGCLCFYHFGWDILDELKKIGFKKAGIYSYWSEKFGHFGEGTILYAKK